MKNKITYINKNIIDNKMYTKNSYVGGSDTFLK